MPHSNGRTPLNKLRFGHELYGSYFSQFSHFIGFKRSGLDKLFSIYLPAYNKELVLRYTRIIHRNITRVFRIYTTDRMQQPVGLRVQHKTHTKVAAKSLARIQDLHLHLQPHLVVSFLIS